MKPSGEKTRIAILGAGYAGIKAFHALLNWLRPGEADLVLINRDRYHWFTTRLHSLAAGEDEQLLRVPLERGMRAPGRLLVGQVQELRPAEHTVIINGEPLPYDYLVVALGSVPEYFGVPGAREHSVTIQQPQMAAAARDAIARLVAAGRAGNQPHLVIAGGGLTGVELAGEVADDARGRVNITLVEGAPDLMPGQDPHLAKVARDVLQDAGVRLQLGVPIAEVEQHHIRLKDGKELPMDLLVWAGGVSGHPLLVHSGLPLNRRGRALVDAHLHSPADDRIYIVGDAAAFTDTRTGRELPPTAQIALQMGEWAARNIIRRLSARGEEPFVPHMRGMLASVGRGAGVAQLGGKQVTGLPALLVKHLVEAHHAYEAGGVLSLVSDLWHLPAHFRLRRRPLSGTTARLAQAMRAAGIGRAGAPPAPPAPGGPGSSDGPGATPPVH